VRSGRSGFDATGADRESWEGGIVWDNWREGLVLLVTIMMPLLDSPHDNDAASIEFSRSETQ